MNASKERVKEINMQGMKKDLRSFIVMNYLFGDVDRDFADEDSFLETGIMDSTGILELIEFVEDTFTIRIKDDEMLPENLDSIHNLCTFISKKTHALLQNTVE